MWLIYISRRINIPLVARYYLVLTLALHDVNQLSPSLVIGHSVEPDHKSRNIRVISDRKWPPPIWITHESRDQTPANKGAIDRFSANQSALRWGRLPSRRNGRHRWHKLTKPQKYDHFTVWCPLRGVLRFVTWLRDDTIILASSVCVCVAAIFRGGWWTCSPDGNGTRSVCT